MPDKDTTEETETKVTPKVTTAAKTDEVELDLREPTDIKPVSQRRREYVHVPTGETYEMSDEDYADMRAHPDRWNGLSCPRSGSSAPFRIGPDGEVVWAFDKSPVDPYNMPSLTE